MHVKRKKKPLQPVTVEPQVWQEDLTWEGERVLTVSLRRPSISGDTAPLRRMERYYARLAALWRERWTGPLYRAACEALTAARAASRPFHPWEVSVDYAVTYAKDGILSLKLETRERTGGARPLLRFQGDVWDTAAGVPVPLRAFFPSRARVKRLLLPQLRAQVEKRTASGEYLYYLDWPRRLKADFSPDRFYLTESGELALFYPLYTLAPYAEGVPVFTVPAPLFPFPRENLPEAVEAPPVPC